MTASIIVVGRNDWDKYTKPFLDSLREHEPDVECIVVDVASDPPYLYALLDDYTGLARFADNVSYAESLNYGALQADDPDWYVFVNNDVLFHKPFVLDLDLLSPSKLHGFHIHDFHGWDYLSGWCLIISKKVWEKIGKFDEALFPMWFEDADYSIRCKEAKVALNLLDREVWGFQHLEEERMDERKQRLQDDMPSRVANRASVRRKHGI